MRAKESVTLVDEMIPPSIPVTGYPHSAPTKRRITYPTKLKPEKNKPLPKAGVAALLPGDHTDLRAALGR